MEIVSTHQPTCRHEVGWCTKHGLLHDEDAHLRSTPPNVHRVGAPSVREGRLPTSFLSPRPLAAGLPARYVLYAYAVSCMAAAGCARAHSVRTGARIIPLDGSASTRRHIILLLVHCSLVYRHIGTRGAPPLARVPVRECGSILAHHLSAREGAHAVAPAVGLSP